MRAILSITLLLLVGVLANGQDGPVKPVQPSPEPTKLDVIQKQLNDLTITLQALQASEKAGENAKRLTKVENEVLNLMKGVRFMATQSRLFLQRMRQRLRFQQSR